jgi:hypothetical protein
VFTACVMVFCSSGASCESHEPIVNCLKLFPDCSFPMSLLNTLLGDHSFCRVAASNVDISGEGLIYRLSTSSGSRFDREKNPGRKFSATIFLQRLLYILAILFNIDQKSQSSVKKRRYICAAACPSNTK